MPNPKKEIDMDALNAITDRVLSYEPPPKKRKKEKRVQAEPESPPQRKGGKSIPNSKMR